MKLWLDDYRLPPDGFWWAKTVEQAQQMITDALASNQPFEWASLDHDLGACPDCLGGKTPEEWLNASGYATMPHCDHFGTGYTLVCWMEETQHWPLEKPNVHSLNASGAARMRAAIDRAYANGR